MRRPPEAPPLPGVVVRFPESRRYPDLPDWPVRDRPEWHYGGPLLPPELHADTRAAAHADALAYADADGYARPGTSDHAALTEHAYAALLDTLDLGALRVVELAASRPDPAAPTIPF